MGKDEMIGRNNMHMVSYIIQPSATTSVASNCRRHHYSKSRRNVILLLNRTKSLYEIAC